MAANPHPYDPRGLIREAYRIDGISQEEVRSIFLDWALSRPDSPGVQEQIAALIAAYAATAPDHPMSETLRAGLEAGSGPPARRGGRNRRRV